MRLAHSSIHTPQWTTTHPPTRLPLPPPPPAARKGWDILLASYLQEFTAKDKVELYIITKPFQTGSNFKQQVYPWGAC